MNAGLVNACQDFEAVILRPMFATLRPATLASDTGDSENSSDSLADGAGGTMESLFADALASAFARAGGLGIARELASALDAR